MIEWQNIDTGVVGRIDGRSIVRISQSGGKIDDYVASYSFDIDQQGKRLQFGNSVAELKVSASKQWSDYIANINAIKSSVEGINLANHIVDNHSTLMSLIEDICMQLITITSCNRDLIKVYISPIIQKLLVIASHRLNIHTINNHTQFEKLDKIFGCDVIEGYDNRYIIITTKSTMIMPPYYIDLNTLRVYHKK